MAILKSDLSRDVGLVRKLVFESLAGPQIRENNLLTRLSEAIGGRRNSIFESADRRVKLETDSKMVPIVARLQRKRPEGGNSISNQWKVEAFGFYDSHVVSDVMKGVNNVHKVSNSQNSCFPCPHVCKPIHLLPHCLVQKILMHMSATPPLDGQNYSMCIWDNYCRTGFLLNNRH